ncbi:hypothetical protein ABGB16_26580 [Micromonospora sp. B11E3]|uniref:hypothetical protein n=1 Tax=Micromonospora sp. B11E3 TaxID=3153562 RepID=UPI00325DADE7
MTYYAVYRNADKSEPAAGIFIMDVAHGHALVWNHRSGAWLYDPGAALRFLDDYRNFDRYEEVEEGAARLLAERITGGAMPGEDHVRARFESGR